MRGRREDRQKSGFAKTGKVREVGMSKDHINKERRGEEGQTQDGGREEVRARGCGKEQHERKE